MSTVRKKGGPACCSCLSNQEAPVAPMRQALLEALDR